MDANAKLGKDLINGDPNTMSDNGKILWDITQRRSCLVVNTTNKCKGTITRNRSRSGKTEESVIDYVIVNQKVEPYVQEMVIDEKKRESPNQISEEESYSIGSQHTNLYIKYAS